MEGYQGTNSARGRIRMEDEGNFKSGLQRECQDSITDGQKDRCN